MPKLLLEIGTEELPPLAVEPVLNQLGSEASKLLRLSRIGVKSVQTTGTVRRLVLIADGVAPCQQDQLTFERGPAARVAFDAVGEPTQAAQGFARKHGVPVEALKVEEIDGGRYVFAQVRKAGLQTINLLPGILLSLIAGLSFPKTMRWTSTGLRFGRPIRWIVALFGRKVIPLDFASISAGRNSRGHRFLAPSTISIPSAVAYHEKMQKAHVVLDSERRRERIVRRATKLVANKRGRPVIDSELLEELVWSTEYPTPLIGAFDQGLSKELPRQVVLTTLQHHQKCFGVEDRNTSVLIPAFIAVRDGDGSQLATVRTGHEWVVNARLTDARFFLEQDRRKSLDQWNAELDRVTYVTGLGTVADHVRRLEAFATWLGNTVGADEAESRTLARAAKLCKADLVTAMVREFPELQGTIGGIYAREAGEPEAVARAIEEHYLPRGAKDAVPSSQPGALLAIADRAVLLSGALSAGLEPTGSEDPYSLRRAASGMVAVLLAHDLHVSLREMFGNVYYFVLERLERKVATTGIPDQVILACVEFVLQRLRTSLIDQGVAYDTVDAVLATGGDDVADLAARAHGLQAVRARPEMTRLATGFARASRILGQGTPAPAVDESLLVEPAETTLYKEWQAIRTAVERACAERRYTDALDALARLADPIDKFFEDVLVMAPETPLRANRLALLRGVSQTFLQVADFAKLAGVKP